MRRLSRTTDLRAGQTVRWTATVRGVTAASTSLRADVDGPATVPTDHNSHMLLLSVGDTAASSHLGIDGRNSTALTTLPDDVTLTPNSSHVAPHAVPARNLPKPHSDDPAPAATMGTAAMACATGTVGYKDAQGDHFSRNIQVQAWDEDPANSDDLLAAGLTDTNGSFRLCFSNDDVSAGQDVYIKVVTENLLSKVRTEGLWGWGSDVYEFTSARRDDVGGGRTVNFGRLAPTDQALHRVLHAFALADDAQAWTPGECWDDRDSGDCQVLDVVYPDDDSNDVSYHSDGTVHLEPAAPDDYTDTVHEYGHFVMWDIYEGEMPKHDNCSPHAMDTKSSQGCAWTEGFANFYPMAIYGKDEYRGWHVEDTTSYNPGDDTEGRVTGSLWDLIDPAGEKYFDEWQESATGAIWDTLLDQYSTTFEDFWKDRQAEGHDVGSGPAGALYQNGLDYGFRFQLADGRSLVRPTPEQEHHYRYDTSTAYWSVTAIRPPTGIDYDLRVYGDNGLTDLLGSSLQTGDTIDFVAADSAATGTGDYYPVVSRAPGETGTGDYSVEISDPTRLFTGSATEAMSTSTAYGTDDDFVSVWDYCPGTPGTDVTFTVTPSDASQDAELFVMDSDPAQPATAVQGRAGALASATGSGPGQPESLTFRPAGGCYGIVLVNRAGSGTYTLTGS